MEIKYLFSCLLQNNFLGVVWNTIASANASAFLFQSTFLNLGGYSATNTITRVLFLNQKIKWETSLPLLKSTIQRSLAYACLSIFSQKVIPRIVSLKIGEILIEFFNYLLWSYYTCRLFARSAKLILGFRKYSTFYKRNRALFQHITVFYFIFKNLWWLV